MCAAKKKSDSSGVLVIGGGIAGAAAALAATEKGTKVTLVRPAPGATALSSGLLVDFRGAETAASPLRRYGLSDKAAFELFETYGRSHFFKAVGEAGLEYEFSNDHPLKFAASSGFVRALAAPAGHAVGSLEKLAGKKIALVHLEGLYDYPPMFIAHHIRAGAGHSLLAELFQLDREAEFIPVNIEVASFLDKPAFGAFELAAALEDKEAITRFATVLSKLDEIKSADCIAVPPVLGLDPKARVRSIISDVLGKEVFEIGVSARSVPGYRLDRAIVAALISKGVEIIEGRCSDGKISGERIESIIIDEGRKKAAITPKAVVLAAGGFIGGGLVDQTYNRYSDQYYLDPIFGLPAYNEDRPQKVGDFEAFTARDFFARQPLFELGLRIDEQSRPQGFAAEPAALNLFAAGASLQSSFGGGMSTALLTGSIAGSRAAEIIDVD